MEILEYLLMPLALASAVGVVFFRNPIFSALSLVINLLIVAAYYALLEAHFLALMQVMVYAGAVVILILFVIMLLNEKQEERPRWFYYSGFLVVFFFAVFLNVFLAKDIIGDFKFSNLSSGAAELGRLIFGKYTLTFEVSALLILVGLIAIVTLGQSKKEKGDSDGSK